MHATLRDALAVELQSYVQQNRWWKRLFNSKLWRNHHVSHVSAVLRDMRRNPDMSLSELVFRLMGRASAPTGQRQYNVHGLRLITNVWERISELINLAGESHPEPQTERFLLSERSPLLYLALRLGAPAPVFARIARARVTGSNPNTLTLALEACVSGMHTPAHNFNPDWATIILEQITSKPVLLQVLILWPVMQRMNKNADRFAEIESAYTSAFSQMSSTSLPENVPQNLQEMEDLHRACQNAEENTPFLLNPDLLQQYLFSDEQPKTDKARFFLRFQQYQAYLKGESGLFFHYAVLSGLRELGKQPLATCEYEGIDSLFDVLYSNLNSNPTKLQPLDIYEVYLNLKCPAGQHAIINDDVFMRLISRWPGPDTMDRNALTHLFTSEDDAGNNFLARVLKEDRLSPDQVDNVLRSLSAMDIRMQKTILVHRNKRGQSTFAAGMTSAGNRDVTQQLYNSLFKGAAPPYRPKGDMEQGLGPSFSLAFLYQRSALQQYGLLDDSDDDTVVLRR